MSPSSIKDRVADQKAVANNEPGAVERQTKGRTVLDMIKEHESQFARALPSHMAADRFIRVALTQLRTNPELMKCSPPSLLGALMLSAQLGLEPGVLGHAYLLPFRNSRTGTTECQFIIGYKGFIDLAYRSKAVVFIDAHEVCKGDEFSYEYGLNPDLRHVPNMTERGEPYAFYAVAKFKDGGHTFIVLSKSDVDRYRGRSKASKSGPWVTDYTAMALKTCVRRLATFLPQSVEMAAALVLDESVPDRPKNFMDVASEMVWDEPPMDAESTPADGADPPPADEEQTSTDGASKDAPPPDDNDAPPPDEPPSAPSSDFVANVRSAASLAQISGDELAVIVKEAGCGSGDPADLTEAQAALVLGRLEPF